MGPINDVITHMNPAYQQGYKDGFKAAQRAAERRLAAILKEIKNLEPYSTYTDTANPLDI